MLLSLACWSREADAALHDAGITARPHTDRYNNEPTDVGLEVMAVDEGDALVQVRKALGELTEVRVSDGVIRPYRDSVAA